MEFGKGELYVGRNAEDDAPLVYDADNLTTHGVIVGMTGSGKTGLGIDLIEEALLNGISCLIIDPKGDMGNLALLFPNLSPVDFEPWMDESTASKEGKTVAELAESTADLWRTGLAGHGIGQERMKSLSDEARVTIYTPGSNAGVALNVLGSLKAPPLDFETEGEVIRAEISSFASSLLLLAGIESDPVSGQEHILLSTIIEHFWTQGKDLDLATLVGQIPNPPFRKMGVFDIDAFFPEKDRMALAMKLNGLLASPAFATWLDGEPLDIEQMIGGPETKAAIVYMSHLTDEERQFLVTLLLGKTVTWIRSQPGTSELRALIYMDEVFGFAPPTKEPPSKTPILTILKQARAHGVGMVLSTQNPVDLDYKAMSNSGTWMIGRLQTENDKRRVLEGLKSASGNVDIDEVDRQISDLAKRQFLLHSTKESGPSLFGTRWAMSYLAGPLTRDQVTQLTKDRARTTTEDLPRIPPAEPEAPSHDGDDVVPVAPRVADGIRASFIDHGAAWASEVGADPTGVIHEPAAAATVSLLYDDTKAGINHRETYEAVIFPLDGIIDPEEVIVADHDDRDFRDEPPSGVRFRLPQVALDTKAFWSGLETDLRDHLVANRPMRVFANQDLKLFSRVDESEEDFRKRCAAAAEDTADAALASLRDKFATRIDRVREQMAAAQARYHEADAVAAATDQENLMGTAGDLLGAFLGGKSRANPLKNAANRRAQSAKARAKADTEAAKYHAKHQELVDLEAELAEAVNEIVDKHQELGNQVTELEIPLEKVDVRVAELRLVWIPVG